ncbi:MAG TPA: cyclase family protein [Povalibacter sp.]|mgnify:CR=1 FL=1|uniref:cyclase family protein n=1 Tax=Povalibacter sp. TaxID=1962978 RepID=UPI002D023BED|nr:cyclase family protein [Povalibacter sp.]HMN45039.1 cyclase family protein [Povalibacter sp.]
MNSSVGPKRVQFDFEVEFLNGGGLQGQGFRLDIDGDDIADDALANYLVRDLRLLMVGRVAISRKTILSEPHKRSSAVAATTGPDPHHVDLSHTIEDGMITYKGLPAPLICDHLSRAASRALYAEGTEFQIGRITMVSNTGTYIDSPFHRYADGADLSALRLDVLTGLDAVVVRVTGMAGRAIPREAFAPVEVRGRAVLVHTGWATHWRTDQYFEGHPFLTADAATYLQENGAALVGIDSYNIDDTADGRRPVHTELLGAGIPIVEHLRGLEQLPVSGLRFSAVPPKVRGMGTFPVRAFATL